MNSSKNDRLVSAANAEELLISSLQTLITKNNNKISIIEKHCMEQTATRQILGCRSIDDPYLPREHIWNYRRAIKEISTEMIELEINIAQNNPKNQYGDTISYLANPDRVQEVGEAMQLLEEELEKLLFFPMTSADSTSAINFDSLQKIEKQLFFCEEETRARQAELNRIEDGNKKQKAKPTTSSASFEDSTESLFIMANKQNREVKDEETEVRNYLSIEDSGFRIKLNNIVEYYEKTIAHITTALDKRKSLKFILALKDKTKKQECLNVLFYLSNPNLETELKAAIEQFRINITTFKSLIRTIKNKQGLYYILYK